MAQAPAPMNAMQKAQLNNAQRMAVTSNAIKMKQQIFSQSVDPTSQSVINVSNNNLRMTGMLLGFVVEVEGTILNTAAGALTRTGFGNSNMLSEIRFDDLSQYTRIQVPGWYLAMLDTIRQGYGYGGVYANNIPMGYGVNYNVYSGDATVAAGANTTDVKMMYYVPISYSNTDLRGSIFMQTTSATANLQLTLNTTPCVAAGANPLTAIYTGNAAATWQGNVTVTVYQVYLFGIPKDQNGAYIIPFQDVNTIYDLKQTTFVGPTVAQDFPMAYSNYRAFLSTLAVFDNGGSFNAGTDINYWSLVTANFTNIWRVTPEIAALDTRAKIMTDLPAGCALFESRDIPVNTINYGSMELNLNASAVNANARVLVGYESFGIIDQLVGASSLAGG